LGIDPDIRQSKKGTRALIRVPFQLTGG